MHTTLYINDNALLIEQGGQLHTSQGYALLKSNGVVFDIDDTQKAVNECRRHPQEINNRYWQLCDESSIGSNKLGFRHNADLIWQHLLALRDKYKLENVTMVVPSHYQTEQLEVLLGVAEAAGLHVVGIVNKAVAAISTAVKSPEVSQACFIDLQLHQAVISNVIIEKGLCRLDSVDVLSDVSINLIYEQLLHSVQQNFIQSDRFDPLHHAESEQQVFDQLSELAQQIGQSSKTSLAVQHGSRLYNTVFDQSALDEVLSPTVKKLRDAISESRTQFTLLDINGLFNDSVPKLHIPSGSLPSFGAGEELVYVVEQAVSIAPSIDSATRSSEVVSVETGTSPQSKTEVTHLLIAGQAMVISRAEINMIDGQLRISDGIGNIEKLLSDGSLVLMGDGELKVNSRLTSPLADGIILAIQVS